MPPYRKTTAYYPHEVHEIMCTTEQQPHITDQPTKHLRHAHSSCNGCGWPPPPCSACRAVKPTAWSAVLPIPGEFSRKRQLQHLLGDSLTATRPPGSTMYATHNASALWKKAACSTIIQNTGTVQPACLSKTARTAQLPLQQQYNLTL